MGAGFIIHEIFEVAMDVGDARRKRGIDVDGEPAGDFFLVAAVRG